MVACEICGGVEFETHAGFMYCSICQTQSQEYHEQDYEYQENDRSRSVKKPNTRSQSKKNVYDDGVWTSWEAFNYILYGMTQELIQTGLMNSEFQSNVLKFWSCYLQECKVGFTSKYYEKIPTLCFNYKHRDARILYNFDAKEVDARRKRRHSRLSSTSNSLANSSISARSISAKKKKIVADSYKELRSQSNHSNLSLQNETLESLGRSNDESSEDDELAGSDYFTKSFRVMLSRKDFKTFKKTYNSVIMKKNAKSEANRQIESMAKNKLLSILHLASLVSGSEVQLSDLLRLIRESHLSFAKVTHFLPTDFRFCKTDFSYIDVISDPQMPTHLRQRKITSQLAYLLKIEKIMTPNLSSLVGRYCQDLNLPESIKRLSEKFISMWVPKFIIPRRKSLLPSFEAWAMVSIIFVMKLLLGLNDSTEIFLSELALEINRFNKDSGVQPLFVFSNWQKFIECRKSLLIEHHYPTREQLDSDSVGSSKMFLHTLMKESKDEHRNDRFFSYNQYYMDQQFLDSIKQLVKGLTKPMTFSFIEFKPSLTPQSSYLNEIIESLSSNSVNNKKEQIGNNIGFAKSILCQNFQKCDMEFVYDLEKYIQNFETNKDMFSDKFQSIFETVFNLTSSPCKEFNPNFFLKPSSRYWIIHDFGPMTSDGSYFRDDVFERTPKNFQWLITECARMLEMNIQDVYIELVSLEKKLLSNGLSKPKDKPKAKRKKGR